MHGKRHIIDILFIIALIGVFAVSSFLVTALGISVYKDTYEISSQNSSLRTASMYVCEKVRQSDGGGSVSIGDIEGTKALVVYHSIGGVRYETWIYAEDGSMRELTVSPQISVRKQDGQRVLKIEALDFSLQDNVLSISAATKDGTTFTTKVFIVQGAEDER